MAATKYRFTFGPWNISTGRDPFGPEVRKDVQFAAKIREYKKLGFDGVQFHDDDVCPADLDFQQTMDGGYTSNGNSDRKYAIERSKRAIDIANAIGCGDLVLWLAREGSYIREA